MKTTLTIAFMAALGLGLAQTTQTTYYDYKKTKKKEVYQVDANGERNGIYKNYDESGALVNEVTFKFGKKQGTWIEYTKFPNYTGKMQIKSKETYVNDVLEGPAIYYKYDMEGDLGLYEGLKGNYKNGTEDGAWIKIAPFPRHSTEEIYDFIKPLPMFVGSMGIKETVNYSNGEIIASLKDEKFYYPSNKLYLSTNYDGNYTGDETYFYPDGKIWSKKVLKNDKRVSFEKYFPDGKVWKKEVMNPYSYEGYNTDGTPDNNMLQTQREINSRKVAADNLNQAVVAAKKDVANGDREGIDRLYQAIMGYMQWRDNTYTFVKQETEELKAAQDVLKQLQASK